MGRLENFVTKPELAAALATLKAELMAEMSAMEMRLTKAMLRQTYAILSAVVALAIGGAIARLIVHWFESRRGPFKRWLSKLRRTRARRIAAPAQGCPGHQMNASVKGNYP